MQERNQAEEDYNSEANARDWKWAGPTQRNLFVASVSAIYRLEKEYLVCSISEPALRMVRLADKNAREVRAGTVRRWC